MFIINDIWNPAVNTYQQISESMQTNALLMSMDATRLFVVSDANGIGMNTGTPARITTRGASYFTLATGVWTAMDTTGGTSNMVSVPRKPCGRASLLPTDNGAAASQCAL